MRIPKHYVRLSCIQLRFRWTGSWRWRKAVPTLSSGWTVPDAAEMLEQHAAEANVSVQYTIIVDSGLHRFGVPPTDTVKLLKALSVYPHLIFRGISTHPGHVYGANHPQEIPRYCQDETQSMAQACQVLREAGYSPDIVSSGSTPTYEGTLPGSPHRHLSSGNYIFNDVIQLSNGAATQQQCALTVLASVISHPRGIFSSAMPAQNVWG